MLSYMKLADDKTETKGQSIKKREPVRMTGTIPFRTEERDTWFLVKEVSGGFKEEEIVQLKE